MYNILFAYCKIVNLDVHELKIYLALEQVYMCEQSINSHVYKHHQA